ncbi:MAG: DNA repair protein RecN [Proteobacteria bacterium]|nr:DNA repair protein RecN [Pseudomonadota bacterium]
MLVALRITDYAIIEHVELQLHGGLNVVTGETGAGKSIIVGATGLLRGDRASAELVRRGCKEAVIEALFDLSQRAEVVQRLNELGLPVEGDELVIRRIIGSSGRGRVYVNGALCTTGVLARLTERLLDLAGQHEHQTLADRTVQRSILDGLGVPPADLAAMAQAFARLQRASLALRPTALDERSRAERLDFLRYQLRELEAAELRAGEEALLDALERKLRSAAELRLAAEEGEDLLYGADEAVAARIAPIARRLAELCSADPELAPLVRQLDEARVLVEDAARELGRYAEHVEVNVEQLQQVEQRLDLLHRLKRKHSASIDELLERVDGLRREADELAAVDEQRETLEAELNAARAEVRAAARRLSAERTAAASRLGAQVSTHLQALHMPGARLSALIEGRAVRDGDDPALVFEEHGAARRVGPEGWDRVDFQVAINPGEALLPIGRAASGGELSRLVLALRQVVGSVDPVSTSIFDEVDAGIGGAVADVVGRALAAVAEHRQVLVVTHLPQVAAYAKLHLHVGKTQEGGRTRTAVRILSAEERVEELARMLAGSELTEEARAQARRLLAASANVDKVVDVVEVAPRSGRKGRSARDSA